MTKACSGSTQTGFSMIEAMVSIVVLSFGVLALAGLQLRVLVDSGDASHKIIASQLANAVADRIRANPVAGAATANPYVTGWSVAGETPRTVCASATASCGASELATYDLWAWKSEVAAMLPGGQANVEARTGSGGLLFVHIAWDEPAVTYPIVPPDAWACPPGKACQELTVAVPQP